MLEPSREVPNPELKFSPLMWVDKHELNLQLVGEIRKMQLTVSIEFVLQDQVVESVRLPFLNDFDSSARPGRCSQQSFFHGRCESHTLWQRMEKRKGRSFSFCETLKPANGFSYG
jgi:hypothetical protein